MNKRQQKLGINQLHIVVMYHSLDYQSFDDGVFVDFVHPFW